MKANECEEGKREFYEYMKTVLRTFAQIRPSGELQIRPNRYMTLLLQKKEIWFWTLWLALGRRDMLHRL
jgi:hypothetical protein